MIISRNGHVVTTKEGVVLSINRQQTKERDESEAFKFAVVKVEGLEGSNGAKWLSLAKIPEGEEVELSTICVARPHSGGTASLTPEEKAQIADLEAQIASIKEAARARKPKKMEEMSQDELLAFMVEKYGQEEVDKMIKNAKKKVSA